MQEKRKFGFRVALLSVIWVLLLVLCLAMLSILAAFYATNNQGISSLSWAGYTIEKNSNPHFEVIGVNASWVVPQVNASAGNGYSSAWIGVGGELDKTLIQVGTEQDVVNGQASYSAWYELLPSFAVRLTSISVSPGDTIIASLNLVNSGTNMWSIQISDATNGQGFSKNVVYNSTRSSAEWIVERPTVGNQTSTLSDFGSITFTGCNVNVNNVTGSITKFAFSKIVMTSGPSTKLAAVSALTVKGTSFTANYLAGS